MLGRAWVIGQVHPALPLQELFLTNAFSNDANQVTAYTAFKNRREAHRVIKFSEGKGVRPNILSVTHGFQWDYRRMEIDYVYRIRSPC